MPLPSEIPEWSVPDPADITDPAGLKSTGWQSGDPFLRQHANWLFKWISDWRAYIVDELIPDTFAPFFEEHAGDGTHTDITADSAVFAGSISVGDATTTNSLVVTNSGTVGDDLAITNNVTIGNALSVGDSITVVDAVAANSVIVNLMDTDEINEKTAAAGITINNELILNNGGNPYVTFEDGAALVLLSTPDIATSSFDVDFEIIVFGVPASASVVFIPGKSFVHATLGQPFFIVPDVGATPADLNIPFSGQLSRRAFAYSDTYLNVGAMGGGSGLTAEMNQTRTFFLADYMINPLLVSTDIGANGGTVTVVIPVQTNDNSIPWEGMRVRLSKLHPTTTTAVLIQATTVGAAYSTLPNVITFTLTGLSAGWLDGYHGLRFEAYCDPGDIFNTACLFNRGYLVGPLRMTGVTLNAISG